MRVVFVDTSILCNLLPVPGKNQDEEEVRKEMEFHLANRTTMMLPIATVVETGNHIAQISDGYQRRQAASLFASLLELVKTGQAPWIPHEFEWGQEFIGCMVSGGSTGADLVELATQKVGCGDLSILVERDVYKSRTQQDDVVIWTMDEGLRAYA